jgi:heterodisulfide reductase subunit D
METVNEINVDNLGRLRLIELDACTNCGACIDWCPVIAVAPEMSLSISPPAKIRFFKKLLKSQYGLRRILFGEKDNFFNRAFRTPRVTKEELSRFVSDLYACSTCRQCHFVCPTHIDTVELWEGIRRSVVDAEYGPLDTHKGVVTSSKAYDNPWQQPRSTRAKWTKVAKKGKRIKEVPHMFRVPKEVAPPMPSRD